MLTSSEKGETVLSQPVIQLHPEHTKCKLQPYLSTEQTCQIRVDAKKLDTRLLAEVKMFEPEALKTIPQKKKNLTRVSISFLINLIANSVLNR